MVPALHRHTPTLSAVDPRGMAVRTVRYERTPVPGGEAPDDPAVPSRARVTRTVWDAAGRAVAAWDPRLGAAANDAGAVANLRTAYSLSGAVLAQARVDAGWTATLYGAASEARAGWDGRGTAVRRTYDAQLRPLAVYERLAGAADERCVERWRYGGPAAAVQRGAGRVLRHDDPAGTRTWAGFALTGDALAETQRFRTSLAAPDWPEAEAERDALLEPEAYTSAWRYDATGAVLRQTDARGHVQAQRYTVAGALAQTRLTLAGGVEQVLVDALGYDAEGRVVTQTAGNGVVSTATFDPASGRLVRLQAHRGDGTVLQDLGYRYDPAGNVVAIAEATVAVRYWRNRRVDGVSAYRYDTLDRLVEATGREAADAAVGPALPGWQPVGADRLTPYTQTYAYDAGDNLVALRHHGVVAYTRRLAVAATSNRALPARADGTLPDEAEIAAGFDARGNLRTLQPGGAGLHWDGRNQLQRVAQVVRQDSANDAEAYIYDGGGQRLRKRGTRQAQGVTHTTETRYLPGLELHTDSADGEDREVVAAAAGRAQVRVLHWRAGQPAEVPNDLVRFSLGDHLGSATLELDATAQVISTEGYYPYGGSAWRTARNAIEADYRTVRYSGQERDATGLYYYGFRYYAPWQQRWLNPDPAAEVDGLNPYLLVSNSPITFGDPDGRERNYAMLGALLIVGAIGAALGALLSWGTGLSAVGSVATGAALPMLFGYWRLTSPEAQRTRATNRILGGLENQLSDSLAIAAQHAQNANLSGDERSKWMEHVMRAALNPEWQGLSILLRPGEGGHRHIGYVGPSSSDERASALLLEQRNPVQALKRLGRVIELGRRSRETEAANQQTSTGSPITFQESLNEPGPSTRRAHPRRRVEPESAAPQTARESRAIQTPEVDIGWLLSEEAIAQLGAKGIQSALKVVDDIRAERTRAVSWHRHRDQLFSADLPGVGGYRNRGRLRLMFEQLGASRYVVRGVRDPH